MVAVAVACGFWSCGNGGHHEPRPTVGVAEGASARPDADWGGLTYLERPNYRGHKLLRLKCNFKKI
ncbi:hypothetical protein ES288_1Z042200v1 [Gossypium darwinii]|uniref:Uncharacterized protein n=1 Tax=Gossypium darwinii TaxID=34276 RepID=A0A5C7J0C0_GOSDA|nr:hypothetical protein ES288_1Z042200v1 [Gossypium darwinii]